MVSYILLFLVRNILNRDISNHTYRQKFDYRPLRLLLKPCNGLFKAIKNVLFGIVFVNFQYVIALIGVELPAVIKKVKLAISGENDDIIIVCVGVYF